MAPPPQDLLKRLRDAFAVDLLRPPATTLREADTIDSYGEARPVMVSDDSPTPSYLNRCASGISYLDAASWRHYLPALGELAINSLSEDSLAVSGLIQSLRPPDREPPRLGSLDAMQEIVLRELLELVAYSADSIWQSEACQALEERWIEGALYRPAQ